MTSKYFFRISFISAFYLFLAISLVTFNSIHACDEETFSNPQMPFKLGFEFQEINGLCPWALNDDKIQKKSVFLVKDITSNRELWEVVIEFVTKPFSYKEGQLLKISINTIVRSLNDLKDSINQEHPTTFESWIKTLIQLLPVSIEYPELHIYEKVKNKILKPESLPWVPHFAPQATIQHPLEYAIPLYFSLFGFNSEYMPTFSASLPLRDDFMEAQKEADSLAFGNVLAELKKKLNGLVFLHALTLTQMAPSENSTDEQLLEETQEAYDKYQQVDPKMKLAIMSRRPFSQMYEDIKAPKEYFTHFQEVMGKNRAFYQVPELFSRVNYAEQFFDLETASPKNLLTFCDLINEDFREKNIITLMSLLERGIISTTMIRNFKNEVKIRGQPIALFLKYYYNFLLMSVDTPTGGVIMDVDNKLIIPTEWDHDLLSPPVFLNTNNSMGRFREKRSPEELKEYGEAIVEIRGIKSIQSWCLKKCGLEPELSGKFLVTPDSVEEHSLKFFNYLNDFGSLIWEYEIFTLGFSHTLRKFY